MRDVIVSGENGAIIYFGIDFPIKKEIKFEYSNAEENVIQRYKDEILTKYKDSIWLQNNIVNFSYFIKDVHMINEIKELTESYVEGTDFVYYLHPDNALDIIHKSIDKGYAIRRLIDELNIKRDNVITVGDGVNDVPMFKESKFSIGINRDDTSISVSTKEDIFKVLNRLI